MKLIFMGTPDFAVPALDILVKNNYEIVGVITAPDKPVGRGQKMGQTPVKEYALTNNLNLLQPTNLKDPEFLDQLKALDADLQIVVAFRMLPEVVWNMPAMGTFNLHASLLPQYRGAAPINWAIVNGDKETGITTFFLTHQIDTGKILFQERIEIGEKDNAETVHDKLMVLGADLVLKTVIAIESNTYKAIEQEMLYTDESELKKAPKLFKENTRIDWNESGKKLVDFIRGFSPYPAAWTQVILGNETLTMKVFEAEFEESDDLALTGILLSDGKSYLKIKITNGYLLLKDIQLSGKKRMNIAAFLCGIKLENFKINF